MWTNAPTKLCVLLAAVSFVAASSVPELAIVGGHNTTIEEHPYQLSLEYHGEHYCGAVLIRRNVALTGAHCFDTDDVADFKNVYRMRVGTSFRNTGGKLGALQDVILHPQWNPTTFDFDIAVVRICNCFDYTPAFYRVDMMPANAFLPEGTIGTVTGYGRLSFNGEFAPVLQAVDMPVVNLDKCREVYENRGVQVTNQMFCAGSFISKFDFCNGDNGGPMVANGILVGLASWGYECAAYGYPGVYTRISVFRNWIDAQLV